MAGATRDTVSERVFFILDETSGSLVGLLRYAVNHEPMKANAIETLDMPY